MQYPNPQIIRYVAAWDTEGIGTTGYPWSHSNEDVYLSVKSRALKTLRLVSKAFCATASRALFRHVTLRCRDDSNIRRDLEKLEEFSKGTYATAILKVHLRMSYSPLLRDLDNGISPILAKFPNLKAFQLTSGYFTTQERDLAMLEINFGLNFVRDGDSLESRNATSVQIDPELGLQNLKHLGLRGPAGIDQDGAAELYRLLRTAVNLDSLQLESFEVAESLDINNVPRLQYLNLRLLEIPYHDLLSILKQCKGSLISIHFGAVRIEPGSMLHLLFQISRDLDLLEFEFTDRRGFRSQPTINHRLKSQYVWDKAALCYYAFGDIQRQVISKRRAAGLPMMYLQDDYFTLPPLKSVMEEARFQELASLPEI